MRRLNECVNSSEWKRGVKSGGGGPWRGLAWIGVYRQGGGRVRQGRSRGGRVWEKEETGQKFAIISVEDGAGGWCVEERGFFWVVEEWEGVRAHFCQFKQRHLSEGASGVCLHMFVCLYVCVCMWLGRQGDDRTLVAPGVWPLSWSLLSNNPSPCFKIMAFSHWPSQGKAEALCTQITVLSISTLHIALSNNRR